MSKAAHIMLYLPEAQRTQVPVLGLLICPLKLEAEKRLIGVTEWREAMETSRLESTVQSGRLGGSKSGSCVPKLCVTLSKALPL